LVRAQRQLAGRPERAVAVLRRLIERKRQGSTIANSLASLETMIAYFRDPDSMRVLVQDHAAGKKPTCAALSMMQIQANGDVTMCSGTAPVGNVKTTPIRRIWADRPDWWRAGCCHERRMSEHEKATVGLAAPTPQPAPAEVAAG